MLFLRFAAHCVSLLCLRCSLFGHAFPIYAMPLLIGATPCDSLALPSKPRQSFAKMFQAMQCLCGSARFTARRYFALALLDIAFPLPCHASPLLLFFMPRLAFPLLLLAYQFLFRSIHCDDVPLLINSIPSCANPLQINSWLCAAFALLSCALPCHSLLCPCAADQETSAQRKRPLPELRHWPRPR